MNRKQVLEARAAKKIAQKARKHRARVREFISKSASVSFIFRALLCYKLDLLSQQEAYWFHNQIVEHAKSDPNKYL